MSQADHSHDVSSMLAQPLAASVPATPARAITQRAAFTQANAAHRYEVTRADLPLSCPMPEMTLWNAHPRVFLPVEQDGAADCPYCGAHYVLVG